MLPASDPGRTGPLEFGPGAGQLQPRRRSRLAGLTMRNRELADIWAIEEPPNEILIFFDETGYMPVAVSGESVPTLDHSGYIVEYILWTLICQQEKSYMWY